MTTELQQRPSKDEINFSAIFAILWKRRVLIVLGTLTVTILAAGFSLIMPRVYRSYGFYQLSGDGVPIPLYKSSSQMFGNPNRFSDYAGRDESFSENEKQQISKKFQESDAIQKWITPLFAFSREDQRNLPAVGLREQINVVLGLNLFFEAKSPEQASNMVSFLGRYVRDCLMQVTLFNYVSNNAIEAHTDWQKNENVLIENQFQLDQQQKKLIDMQSIQRKYPGAASVDNRQLVSIQDGGARFLSPVTQLVGIESTVIDLRREVARLEREREKILPRVEFFDLGKVALKKAGGGGESLFQALKDAHKELFATKNLSQDTMREVYNQLSINLQNFDRAFYTSYRFVSGPTMPMKPSKPSKKMIVLIAFFMAAFFFVFLVFVLFWWQNNKQAILADSKKK